MFSMRYKILVSTYAGTSNKGAEALLCGLATILEKKLGKENFILSMSSIQPDVDRTKGLHLYEQFYQRATENYPTSWRKRIICLLIKIVRKLKWNDLKFYLEHYELLNAIRKQDLFIEMGADNYDVEYGGYEFLLRLHQWLKEHTNVKMLLYDCSLNLNSITPEFLEEINRFDGITIRESESMENLSHQYQGDKIQLIPDPAFVMEPVCVSLPHIMNSIDCVGINLSDLIMRKVYGVSSDLIYANYYAVIDYILSETRMGVVLLPHVMKGQDLTALRKIKTHYASNDRVILVENEELSAPQLKYIISKFRFLLTARTHASIAAYSTYVPTLVLGYSVKSRGIAKELFGTHERYVIAVSDMHIENDLLQGFSWLMNNEENIKKQLRSKIPLYQKEAMKVGDIIKELLK